MMEHQGSHLIKTGLSRELAIGPGRLGHFQRQENHMDHKTYVTYGKGIPLIFCSFLGMTVSLLTLLTGCRMV